MGKAYLIDTSAYSKYISDLLATENETLMQEVTEKQSIISVVTRIELLSWRTTDLTIKELVEEFTAKSNIIGLTEPIIRQTIRIRRQRRIKLPDAIIAATAMVYDLTLLSTNDSDFEKITGLNYQSLNA
jgi:predicted nucleic acid-binding protein